MIGPNFLFFNFLEKNNNSEKIGKITNRAIPLTGTGRPITPRVDDRES